MKSFIKSLFIHPLYKDWLFILPLLLLISWVIEACYDAYYNSPQTELTTDLLIVIAGIFVYVVPFFVIRYYIKKKQDLRKVKAFISFQTNDIAMVQQIKLYLESYTDLDIWWQENLSAGQNYKQEIEEVLKDSDLIFIMYSQNYHDSEVIRDWELPFIINQETSRDDLIIIPCVVGEHIEEIPFVAKYQVVPSRSSGFHRMLQKEIKVVIKKLSKTILSQIKEKPSFKEYKDPKAFQFLYFLILGYFVIGSFSYLFGLNQRDNLIDRAINFPIEINAIEDEHTLFRQYDDPNNFYDGVIRDSLEHDLNSIYMDLLLDYSKNASNVGYEEQWEELLIHAYNTHMYFENYMASFDPWEMRTEDEKNEQYNKHVESYILYYQSLCSLLDTYINLEDYTFDLSLVWYQEDYENYCNYYENQNNVQ